MANNPYQQPTKRELQKQKEERDAINKRINITVETARRILSSPDGQAYRESIRKLRGQVTQHVMESPAFASPQEDAFFLRSCIIKMGLLDMLMGDIEKDANRHV